MFQIIRHIISKTKESVNKFGFLIAISLIQNYFTL